MPGIEWISTCDNKDFIRSMNEMTAQVRETNAVISAMGKDASSTMDKMNSTGQDFVRTLKEIGAVAGVSFSIAQAKSFVDKIVETRGYFQDIESSMKVFLGNEQKAQEFTNKLKDYAWYNMFEFSDLANASKQMIAYGHSVDSIIPRLDQLSNVARGTSAPLMEMVNAYNRAKNLGGVGARDLQSWAAKGLVIKDILKEMGEEVKGTTVTFEQLNKVLDHVTGEGGMFHNLMGEQLNNITAEQGQLEDNLTSMYNEIGEKYQDTITGVIKAESWLVDHYKEVGTVIMSLIAAYGEYRAAIVTTNAFKNVRQETVKNLEIELLNDEIAKYKELLPEKEAAKNADLAEAVAKGKLTEKQAALIAAKRAEFEQIQIEKELIGVDEKINELKRLKLDEDLQDKVATEQLTLAQAQEVQQRREVLRSLDDEITKRKEAQIAKIEQSMSWNQGEIKNFQDNSTFYTGEAEKYQKEINLIDKKISQLEILGGKEKEIADLNDRKTQLLEMQAAANDKIISNTEKIKSLQESNVELARREEEIKMRYGNADEKLDILNNQKISLEQQLVIAQKDAEQKQREYDIVVQTRLAEEDELRVLKEKLAKEQAINEERAKKFQMPNDLSSLSQQVDDQQAVVDALNDETHAKQENSMATAAQEAAEKAQNIQEQINTLEEQANSIATGTNTKAKAGNTTATNALTVSEKIHNAALIAGTTASKIFTTAVNQVKTAIKGLGAAIMTNPIGVLVGALTIGLPWLMEWINGTDDAAEMEERYGNEAKEAESKVKSLLSVIQKTDQESKVHKDSVAELERIYKDYGIELEKTKDAHNNEIVTVTELKNKHKLLVDVLKQEAIERQKANDISDANKEYETETEETTKRVKKGLSDTFTKAEKNQLANYLGEEDYERVTEALYKYKKALEEAKETYGDGAYKYVVKEYEEYNKALDSAQNKVEELAMAMKKDSEAQQEAGKWARWQAERYAELGTEQKEMIDNANKAAAATWKASDAQDANARKIRYAKMSTSELKRELEMMVQAYGNTRLNVTIDFEQTNVPEWMKGMDLKKLKQQSSFWATQAGDMLKKGQKERVINGQKFSAQEVATKANQYRIARSDAEAAKEAADAEAARKAEEAKKNAGRLAKETAARNAKMLQDQWKHEEEMTKLERDAARAREDASIASIQSQSERERAEMEAQHNRTIADIKAQENDIYKAIYEQRKKTYELNNKDKRYENTEEGAQGWMGLVAKTLEEVKKAEFDIINASDISTDVLQKLNDMSVSGNVDLISRPFIDAAELVKKGWKDAGEGIATVFSSSYEVIDKAGHAHEILVTPILPDGTVWSEQELEDYLGKQLDGAENILSADTKGVVIAVDVDRNAGEELHLLQEQLLNLPTDKLNEIQQLYANLDTRKFDDEELKKYRLGMDIIKAKMEETTEVRKRQISDEQKMQLQSMRDYLKEYGTFQQQKLAVAEEYAQKIKDAEGNEGEVLRLQAELQKKNAQIEVNAIKEGVDWNVVFGDLGNILKDQIEPTIERLERITQSEDFKALGTEEKREVYDLIKNLRTQQEEWGKVSLTEIGVLVNEYQDILARKNAAEEEEVRLQELYNKALENNLKVQNDPKATAAEKKAAEEAVKSAKKAWDESAKNVQNLGKEASTTSAKLQSASDRMRSDIERLGNALSGLTSGSLKGVYDSFSELDKMFNGGKMTAKVEELVGKLYNNLFKQDNIDYIQQLVSNKIGGYLDDVPEEEKKKVIDTLGEKISGLLDGKEGTEIKKEIGDALTNLLENPEVKDKVKEGAEEVVDTLGEAVGNGGIIGAIIALILGLLDALKEEGVGGIVAALIDMILGAIDGIIKNIISGDFVVQIVGAIVKGIGNLLNTITFGGFDSWFGLNNDNHDEMLERQAKYNSMLDTAANAVKHFTDELEKSYGFLAIQNAKQAKDAVTSTMDTIMKGIDSVMWDRYGGGSSDYFHANKALNWVGGDLERAGAVEFFKRYGLNMEEGTMRDFWSGEERTKYTWNQLFNGNDPMKIAQAFKEMRDSGNDLWRIITTEMGANDGALKEWIEKLIDAYDQLDTIEKEKLEQLTTTTSENVFDDFRNSLYELADGSEDVTEQIAQNWQKMVNEMAVNNIVIEGFRGELDEWYADLAKANEELTNTQDTEAYQNSIDALSKQYDDMMQRAGDRISQLTEMGVIKPIEESAEEGKGAFQEMTDSWVSSLMDFGATAEDWAENIGQAMAQKIINEMVVPTLIQPLLDNLQTAFDKAMEENTFTESSGKKAYYWTKVLDNEGLKAAIEDINNAYPELKETVQGIMSMAGIDAKEEFSNSLDGIGDTLIDNLLSLGDDAEDIGKKVGSALIREMIEQMLASGDYAERMEAIRQMWQDVLTGKDTTHTREDVISDLRQLQEDMASDQNMTSLVSEWKDLNKELEKTKQGFSDLRSTITNSLTSAESTIEDFSKSLGKSMMSQMLDAYIDSNYKEEITALSEEWGEALASGNTKAVDEIQQKVISLYQTIGNEDIEVKNLTDAIKEIDRALDTTFSSMTDSWVSALMDMEGTAEQFAENVGKTMAQKIITEMVAPIYLQPLLNSMQDAYDSAMDVQGASIESVMNTMSPYLNQVKIVYNEIKPMVEGIFGGFGIYKKAAEEATEEVEYRLGDLKSNFTSALMDMENSAADFSKDISRVLAQNFIENFVLGDRFDQQMDYWKRQYESIIGSGMSEDERKRQLKALRDSIATAKQGYVNSAMAIQELLGITTEDNQEATMNMADKITYDQADQLLGINLAQELTLEQILATIQGRSVIPTFTSTLANEEMSRQVAATLQAMSEVSRAGSDNILTQLATANSHLQLIRDYSKNIRDEVLMHLGSIDMKLTNLRNL